MKLKALKTKTSMYFIIDYDNPVGISFEAPDDLLDRAEELEQAIDAFNEEIYNLIHGDLAE